MPVRSTAMPRQARCNLPSAGCYHVTNRGVARQEIYRDDDDHRLFAVLLGWSASRFRWRLLAFCHMPNHFHLVVMAERERLSRGMHLLGFRYAQAFNDRHARVGHLFQDRFHAAVVDSDEYLEAACAYVLDNPLRAQLCASRDEWPWLEASGGAGRRLGRVDRRQRRRPRADRRDLAGAAVQLPIAERVLGLHHLVDLRRALVDDRGARVPEVALDAVLAPSSRTSRTPGSRGAPPRRPTRSRATSPATSRASSACPCPSSRRPAARAASTSRSRAPSSRSCPARTGSGRSPGRTSPARARTRPSARGRRGRRRSAPAATVKRPWSSECMAISKPWPSSPIRFSAGTSTFSKKSSPVEPAQMPSLCSVSRRREPLHALLEHEGADSLVRRRRVGLREDELVVGDRRVRDPVLLAVQDVDVALAARGRPHRGDVGAGARLGQPEAGELLALRLRGRASAASAPRCRRRAAIAS